MIPMSVLTVHLKETEKSYPITVENGALSKAAELFGTGNRSLILTDEGVPAVYAETVAALCKKAHILRLPSGEQNKCPETLFRVLKTLVDLGFDRKDRLIAVGGGVIGDLGGFAAAAYMRGIDFYNIPTTLLSQVDSSVGGKVAIDFAGYKNLVGAFYQPKGVLIDPQVLKTLDSRQTGCGLAEALKMFATSDAESFKKFESFEHPMDMEEIILRALKVKTDVVSRDEKEAGLRKILNFGHTVGHAIESLSSREAFPLLHGECVGIGMLCVTEGEVRERLAKQLHRLDLPTAYRCRRDCLIEAISHDKKAGDGTVTVIRVPKIGSYETRQMTPEEIADSCREVLSLS